MSATTLPPLLDTFFVADGKEGDAKSRDMQPACDMDVDVEPEAEGGVEAQTGAAAQEAPDAAPGPAEHAAPAAAGTGQQVRVFWVSGGTWGQRRAGWEALCAVLPPHLRALPVVCPASSFCLTLTPLSRPVAWTWPFQEGAAAKKTATRLTAEQKAVLLASFATNPRPSVAERKQLAAQLLIEPATCDRWFAAERDRNGVPKLARGRPPAQPNQGDVTQDGAPAPMAPTRKRKAAYEVPTDEAGFAQLLVTVEGEVTALQAALAARPANLFAHLQATPAPPLGPGPLLQRAVRPLTHSARTGRALRVELSTTLRARLKRRPPRPCALTRAPPPRVSWPHRWLP